MASTITNLINTIDIGFPVAGQDNDSQGFRNNFNIIQQSLLAQEGELANINNTISTLGGTQYTTATHIHALQDVKIGTTDSAVISVVGNDIVAKINTVSSITLLGVTQSINAQVAYALTESVTTSTTGTFAVLDAKDIVKGAIVNIQSIDRTVTGIDYGTNYVTVSPEFTTPAFSVGDTVVFLNPYSPPVGNLYLEGDIEVTGNITAFSAAPSDARLKENVRPIPDALAKVESMRGVFYDWTDDYLQTLKFSKSMPKNDVGVIAQEMQDSLPEVVFIRSNGELGVKYEKIVAVLIEGIKELSTKVNDLQSQVELLKNSNNV